MLTAENTQLSPREAVVMERETEEFRLAREHAVRMKELEIALARDKYSAEIELRKLEARWSNIVRLPATIIKLPVYLLLSFGYWLDAIRGNEPSKDFWKLFK